MPRKPEPKPLRTPLPHDWRNHVTNWAITAMLAKIPQADYLSEVRKFEADAIANGTLSDDWAGNWHAHCHRRLVAPVKEETFSLFSDL
jgi:hypothetical protein